MKDVREVLDRAERRLGEQGQGTILFLDEVHRFNKAQQDALLPSVETGLLTLIGATTENPYFEVNAAAAQPARRCSGSSRSTTTPSATLLERGLAAEGATADDDALDLLVDRATGDGRQVLTALEVCVALAGGAERARHRSPTPRPPSAPTALRYGRDEHYDVDLRVHQEHPRLRRRRRPPLAGPDARGRRGRPVHRPPPRHPRQRGRRHGRPDGASSWPTPPPGPSSSSGCPRRSSTWPRPSSTWRRRRSRTGRPSAIWQARGDVAERLRPRGAAAPARRPPAARSSVTARADYDYPHDDPRGWVEQHYLGEPAAPALLRAVRRTAPRRPCRSPTPMRTAPERRREAVRPGASSKVAAPWKPPTPPPSSSPSRRPSPSSSSCGPSSALTRTMRRAAPIGRGAPRARRCPSSPSCATTVRPGQRRARAGRHPPRDGRDA